jgi:hypothetical protein
MQLQIGDKFSDESGEWEVIGRPYATAGGKSKNVRVQRVDKPGRRGPGARTRGSRQSGKSAFDSIGRVTALDRLR